jgi:hypothetical protein
MRRTIFLIASVIVSAIFIWLAVRNVDLNQVFTSFTQANFAWVLMAFICISAGMWTRGVRWHGLLDFRAPFMQTAHTLNLGFMLNLLPLRAGEVARALLINRAGVPVMTAATSVIFERLVDTLLVVIMLVVGVSRVPNVPPEVTRTTTLFGAAVIVAFAVMVFFARFPRFAHRLVGIVESVLPFTRRFGLARLLDHVLDGLKPLTHWRSAVHAVVWTLISWTISFFTLYSLVRALNMTDVNGLPLDEGTRLLLAAIGLALTSFSIAIPVSVAGLGPFQAAILAAGNIVGAQEAQSVALGFLFHGINILGYAVWGTIGMLVLGVSLGDVIGGARQAQVPESA